MNPMIYNKMNTEGELILDETVLQMPIKKSKQLQNLLKQRLEQNIMIEHAYNKVRSAKQSRVSPFPQQSSTKNSNVVSTVQKQLKMNQSNSSYVVSCVLRALTFRKLAIDDVADIFGIDGQTVEEIDKFRRIQELQSNGNSLPNLKFDMKKDKLIKQLQMKFNNNTINDRFGVNSFNNSRALSSRKSNFSLYDSRISNNSHIHSLSNFQLSSILESSQKQQEDQNLFEYQKLLRKRPPHKYDDKVKAIIEILKKKPHIMQKQIIQILVKDYNITSMNQTSISRYYKKIHQMKKHCQVLLQAKKDGFIDI